MIVAILLRFGVVGGSNDPEESIGFIVHAGGKEKRVRRALRRWCAVSRNSVGEVQRPQSLILQCVSALVAQQAIEASAVRIIDSDLPAACIADEQVSAVEAEVRSSGSRRSKRDPPGGIKPRTRFEPLEKLAAGRELIDKSQTRSVKVVMLIGVLLRIRYVQVAVYCLDIEWSKAARNGAIAKRAISVVISICIEMYRIETRVVSLDCSGSEVCDIQQHLFSIRGDRCALVHSPRSHIGIVKNLRGVVPVCWIPGRDGAVLGYERKKSSLSRTRLGNYKSGATSKSNAGRSAAC